MADDDDEIDELELGGMTLRWTIGGVDIYEGRGITKQFITRIEAADMRDVLDWLRKKR